MKRLLQPYVAAALVFWMALAAAGQDDHALIAQVAAERDTSADATAPPATAAVPNEQAATAADLDHRERRARSEVTVARMRLELVLARKALRGGDHTAAARHALRVLRFVRALPPGYDASAFELMAEGIVARAARAGADVAALRAAARDATVSPPPAPAISRAHPDTGPPQADAAASVPAGNPVAPFSLRPAAGGNIYYPSDWPEKVARRVRFRGGQIARSESWIDADGHEWYVALYDVHDLIYVPPDFGPYLSLDMSENLRTVTDRNAFWTCGGTLGFWDPARIEQTLAALDYFGGVDPYARRGPKYSVERERQIADMIQAFTTQKTQSEMIILEP